MQSANLLLPAIPAIGSARTSLAVANRPRVARCERPSATTTNHPSSRASRTTGCASSPAPKIHNPGRAPWCSINTRVAVPSIETSRTIDVRHSIASSAKSFNSDTQLKTASPLGSTCGLLRESANALSPMCEPSSTVAIAIGARRSNASLRTGSSGPAVARRSRRMKTTPPHPEP